MDTLIRYELKKLLSRRILWAALTLGMAMMLYMSNGIMLIRDRLGGRVQGMKDVYARYEGQVLTDAVAAQAQEDLDAYILAHPDEFTVLVYPDDYGTGSEEESGDNYHIYPKQSSYAEGLMEAYNRIANGHTIEDEYELRDQMKKQLDSGLNHNSTPLTEQTAEEYRRYLDQEPQDTVIMYMEGYWLYNCYCRNTGMPVLLLMMLSLPWLFTSERTARMEYIVLIIPLRQKLVWAKMITALLWGTGLFILYYGAQELIISLTYGWEGFNAPSNTLNAWWSGQTATAGRIMLTHNAVSLAAVAASSQVLAWISAIYRRPLIALIGSVAVVFVQLAAGIISTEFPFFAPGLKSFFEGTVGRLVNHSMNLLPSMAVLESEGLLRWGEMSTLALGFGLSLLFTVLALWLAPRCWLRQRRA